MFVGGGDGGVVAVLVCGVLELRGGRLGVCGCLSRGESNGVIGESGCEEHVWRRKGHTGRIMEHGYKPWLWCGCELEPEPGVGGGEQVQPRGAL